jgi:hypothetical protein
VILALPRVLLAIFMVLSLPLIHSWQTEISSSDDSLMAMVGLFINVLGLALAVLVIAGGSLAQILLRAKPPRYTVFVETGWLLLIGMVIGCVTLINK